MPLRHRLAGATALTLAATMPALVQAPAHAGALGPGETVVSGATTPVGVGESVLAPLPDGTTLAVWEGVRDVTTGTAQGQKSEIWGRLLDASGAASGSPVLLARMGTADDATQDAVDPAIATLADGRVALVFAGDALADTAGAPTPTETTSWQVQAAIINPGNLGLVTPTAVTAVDPTNAAYDQQHPDVSTENGQVRIVWDGDTPDTGDGKPGIWTTLVPTSLATAATSRIGSQQGTRPRVDSFANTSGVVWEGVTGTDPGGAARRIQAARLSGASITTISDLGVGPGSSAVEELAPDVVAVASGTYRAVWSSNSGGGYAIRTQVFTSATATAAATLTSGGHDTWPSVTLDPAQSGQFVVDFSRRTSTAGPGHYEILSGRYNTNNSVAEAPVQVSTIDANTSYDNAESMRPAVVAHATGAIQHAWSRVRSDRLPAVAVRRSAALVDLTTTVAISPTLTPTPARAGVNPADQLTVTIGYGTTAVSAGRSPSHLGFSFPGFTVTGTTLSDPSVVASGNGWDIPALAPGASGTITLTGTADAAPEGSIRTASATIAASGRVVDDPSTNNTASRAITLDYPPQVVSMARVGSASTNASSVQWTVGFDQTVAGVDASDFVVTNTGTVTGTVSSVVCSGATCTVTADLNTGTGTVTLRLRDTATATDPSGKQLATGNLPFDGPFFTVDRTPPTVSTSVLGPDPTNAGQIDFRLTFSESVSAPAAGKLTVTGGTVGGISGAGDTWTVSVLPSGDGTVSLAPQAAATSDAAGNASLAGNTASTTSDRTAPVLTLTGPDGPQRTAYDVSVTTSEPVTGLDVDDFTVTGGNATGLTGTSPWTLRVQPTAEGDVTVTLPAGSAADAAGNTNPARTTTTVHDTTRPGVTVSSTAGDPTGDSPIVFTLTFSEPVTGIGGVALTAGDLTVTGGTATIAGTGATRTVRVTPDAEGPVSVAVPAGVAQDAAGNTNTAGTGVTRTYDVTGPTPQITTTTTSPSNVATFPVRVTWPEPVAGFVAGDVSVTGGDLSDFAAGPGNSWTFTVTPSADGTVRVAVPAGAATDLAGNSSLAGTPLDVVSDTEAPHALLFSTVPSPTRTSPIPVSVVFTEPVTGLAAADFTTTNATVTSLTGSDGSYTAYLAPVADGPWSVQLPGGAAADAAGNPSWQSATYDGTYDTTATSDLAYSGPALVNGPINLTLTLSDPATITAGDFATTNGTVTSVSGSGSSYDVVFTPDVDGGASVRLPAGAWTDEAGNATTASQTVSITYDGTSPTVTSLVVPTWATAPYDVDVTFSEPVTSFAVAQVVVTNGTAAPATGSGTSWTFEVTPTADGPVGVTIGAGVGSDAAGNPNVGSGTVSTTYDSTPPTVELTSPTGAVATTSPIPVEIDFSETVTDLAVDDLVATNATVSNLAGGGDHWTADLVPAGEGTVTLQVVAGAVEDQAGIGSAASNTLTREFDSTRPTLALTSPVSGTTTASTIPVTARFSKAVLGFEASDLQATGASVTGFTQVDARTWTFDLAVAGDGDVAVRVPDNAAASAGGHLAFGASYGVTVDRKAPVLRVTGPTTVTEDGPITFDVTASEAVTGLDADDLTVSGSARPVTVVLAPGSGNVWRVSVDGMTEAGDVVLAVRGGAVTDAAGNLSAAATGSAGWRPAGTLRKFELLQQPGTRSGNRVTLPVQVTGSDVTFTATSSNEKLLPVSAITLTGDGSLRQLTLAARNKKSGVSKVVVTLRAGDVTRTVRIRMTVGGTGDEVLRGGKGIDVMLARGGSDTMRGGAGDDLLYGGYGADRLVGGPGNDLLVGGPGPDELVGGAGKDVFVTWGKDRLVDVRKGDKVIKPSKSQRRLLRP